MTEENEHLLDHSEEEIEGILEKVYQLTKDGKRHFLDERGKNREFKRKYFLSSNNVWDMVLDLTTAHFCYSLMDKDPVESGRLYVFKLPFEYGENTNLNIYIKFKFKRLETGELILLFSFHEPLKNVPLEHLF